MGKKASISTDEIRAIVADLNSSDLADAVEESLLEGDERIACVQILGHLDAAVDCKSVSPSEAELFYDRLGFSSEERSSIRQSADSKFGSSQ